MSGEMDAAGRKSNHDSDADVKKVAEQLVGALAAQNVGSGLAHLAKKLAQLRTSGGKPRVTLSRRQRPRRPGWVVEAVAQVLADRAEPMRATDIHAAVEASIGAPVACESRGGGTFWRAVNRPMRRWWPCQQE
jgi:hypothetical protein